MINKLAQVMLRHRDFLIITDRQTLSTIIIDVAPDGYLNYPIIVFIIDRENNRKMVIINKFSFFDGRNNVVNHPQGD